MDQPQGKSEHVVQTIDQSLFSQWRVSVLTLLEQVFGPSRVAYREFADFSLSYLTGAQFFHGLVPIFRSAKSDYEGGYLFRCPRVLPRADLGPPLLGLRTHHVPDVPGRCPGLT